MSPFRRVGEFLTILLIPALLLSSCAQNTAGVKDSASTSADSISQTNSDAAESAQTKQAGSRPEKPRFSNIWPHLFSLYALPRQYNPRISHELSWFLKNRDYLDRVQIRAEPYLYEVLRQIEQQGIPGEFALLPVIESAFQPYAYSRARAHGIWQFIPSTGRLYGLKQNWWYDGRRDIYASTQAAIRYLQKLKNDFNGDWLLALAAYNCGEGRVQKAVERNLRRHKPIDFWSLKLPKETSAYVPRLIAVSRIFAESNNYRLKLRPIPDRPQVGIVHLQSQFDLNNAATMAGISLAKLYHLNPAYNQWVSDPAGPHRLLLPVEQVEPFKEKFKNLPAQQHTQWIRHKVSKIDTTLSLAKRYRTTPTILAKVNRVTGNSVRPGNYVVIPVAAQTLSHYKLRANPDNPIKASDRRRKGRRGGKKKIYYRIRNGDTLSKIARRHGVSTKKLAKWNHITTRSIIRPGKKLAIWTKKHSRSKSRHRRKRYRSARYTVRKGDSLSTIARRFNVKVADLRRWNKPKIGKYLRPGQKIKVGRKPAG